METSPPPNLSLIGMKRYSTMAVQYSCGCSFNCEFCDIVENDGRRPRAKAVAQVSAELDELRAAGWREAVFTPRQLSPDRHGAPSASGVSIL